MGVVLIENLLLETDLQRDVSQWKSNSGPDINDPPSDSFVAEAVPDGSMIITNRYAGTEDFAGALVSNTTDPPTYNGALMQYVAMRIRFLIPAASAENWARLEHDLKICVKTRPPKPPGGGENPKIRNVGNCSTQINRDTMEVDIDLDPPGWVGSGYFVTEPAPDVWHEFDYRFWFDPEALVFSVLSLQLDDDEPYMVPAELQNVAMSLTNWEACRKIQLQNEMYKPGVVQIQYGRVDLAWSTAPIPAGLWAALAGL